MMKALTKSFLVGSLLALLAGCVTVTDGPAPAAFIQQSLTGRSWLWVPAGAGSGIYFGPNGEGQISWAGKVSKIKWHAEDGKFCYSGSGSGCWLLYYSSGAFYSRSTKGGDKPYKWHPIQNTRSGNRLF